MSEFVRPSIQTHVAQTVELPPDHAGHLVGRPDAPTPSLWQKGVKAKHKITGEPVLVGKVDWGTNQFRAYYTERPNAEGGTGRWSERTEWEFCRDWDVEVTYSPQELERQAAKRMLEEQIATLDAQSLAMAKVLCDDPDPAKNLAKLQALLTAGFIKGTQAAVTAAVEAKPAKRVSNREEQARMQAEYARAARKDPTGNGDA